MATPLHAEPSLHAWKGTSRYEIIGALGEGGMGVVYEALDRERRQQVAVKTLLHVDAASLYLFKQEFRTLADVQHRNLVHLYELVVPEDGHAFFTMELVRGVDFRCHVQRAGSDERPVPVASVVSLRPAQDRATLRPRKSPSKDDSADARPQLPVCPADIERLRPALLQLAEGIQALHAAGKLHRDVKPSNVLVTAEGRLVLLDFGVATDLVSHAEGGGDGEMVGTARYMAPEQAADEPPTPASDWYSVGVMLYEALAGRPPFVGSAVEILTAKSKDDPTPAGLCTQGVPADLDSLCRALLHRDPAMRPTGPEVLRRLGGGRATTSPPPRTPETEGSFIGREGQLAALREALDRVRSGETVAVRVYGASGMGKSTACVHFVDELTRSQSAVVLRGRAYERESVPFKVVDSVVDALSRHLLRLADRDHLPPLPDDMWALATLFPVLRRVPGAAPPPAETLDDPQAVRRRAFTALRELLWRLGEQPIVVYVDDVHWGDADSASLLVEVLRPPNAPPLLFVMTYRDDEATASPFLTELRERWAEEAAAVDVPVGPLNVEDARHLALTLLGTSDEMSLRIARAVARESRGSPFLIEELVRSNRGVASSSGSTLAVLTLDQMVSERLDRLPEKARELIEIVAVGARPLPITVVAGASGVEAAIRETITLLGARRFARTGLRDGRDVVETIHDRVRETIVSLLPAKKVVEHHRRLARVLEGIPGSDSEAVAMHWLGAGEHERAAAFAEEAADKASAKLAFDHAATLYRLALENTSRTESIRRLRPRLAEALQRAGRYEESAHAFLVAAKGASAGERVEYQRAAAQQLLSAGRLDEGTAVLREVLAAVGMRAPRSPVVAVFWLVVYKGWLALLGLRFKDRRAEQVSAEDRLRIEALFTVAIGFSIVNVVMAACMQARHLVEAIRKGDRFHLARAIILEAAHIATMGKRETRRERELMREGRRFADLDGGNEAEGYYLGSLGVGVFQRGRWKQSKELLERALAVTQFGNAGYANIRIFYVNSRFFLGEILSTMKRFDDIIADAESRRDFYTVVNLRTSVGVHARLALDDEDGALRGIRESLAVWPHDAFHVQHWQAMAFGPDVALYRGEGADVYDAFMKDMPKLRRSMLLHAGFIRAFTSFCRGRFAIAAIEGHPERRDALVADARRMADKLDGEYDPWTGALAAMVRACAENAAGDRDAAVAALRLAIERTEATDTIGYAWTARYRLGQLLGGDEGQRMMHAATEAMRSEGIKKPDRWTAFYLPGRWER